MCLAIPARVSAVDGGRGTVVLGGVRMNVSLALLDDVAPGDYVIVHTGFALSKIDPAEAARNLAALAAAEAENAA